MDLIKVYNQYLDNIAWIKAEKCNFKLNSNLVDIWRVNVNSNLSLIDNFLSTMHPHEVARANRYIRINDKNRFIISRGVLRHILGKYLNILPKAIEFKIGANKKPYLANTDIDLHFNISHSGNWILLAVSNSAIGADTEFINYSFNYNGVMDDNFSVDEVVYIRENTPAECFFMLWTRKEALIKATGKGLDEDLKLIPSLNGIHFVENSIISSSDLMVYSFKLYEQYIASIACNSLISKIAFWDINFIDFVG